MFSAKKIMKLAEEAYEEFSKRHKSMEVELEFVKEDEFFELADRSKLVHLEMREGLPIKVGSLVMHGKKDIIVLCTDVINLLTKNDNFVKALVMHELFHILDKKRVKDSSMNQMIRSEERVHKQFIKEFPNYAELLDEVTGFKI